MAANYSKPVSTDLYTDILVYIKDNITDSIKFLDGSSATNIPSGAKRWNATLSRFEKFDGSTWTALIPDATTSISGLMSAADKTTISGLGTAASSTKQTSVTDTTSGRLMIVGAFGFGTSTPTQLSTASALNNIAITSVYYVAAANVATVGGPSGAGAGVVFTQRYSSTYAVQTYSQVTGGFKSWSRQCNSGTWSSWVEELNTGNILASQIPQTSDYRFVSDAEKTTWNAKASTSLATTSTSGLMSSTDKTKLDTVSANAQKNSDILKSEIEAVLTGTISSHSHAAIPAASTTVAGIIELATTAEAEAGVDTVRAVTPAGVFAAITAAGPSISLPLSIEDGGTGATTASAALTTLGGVGKDMGSANVGSVALVMRNTSGSVLSAGSTYSGSSLALVSMHLDATQETPRFSGAAPGAPISGTWRALTNGTSPSSNKYATALAQRIA